MYFGFLHNVTVRIFKFFKLWLSILLKNLKEQILLKKILVKTILYSIIKENVLISLSKSAKSKVKVIRRIHFEKIKKKTEYIMLHYFLHIEVSKIGDILLVELIQLSKILTLPASLFSKNLF